MCVREFSCKDGSTQFAGNANLHGTSRGAGCPPESKLHRKGVRRRAARHRAKTRKSLAERYGAHRAVSPHCVTLCRRRLAEVGLPLSCLGVRELLYLLQRVLYTTADGSCLGVSRFSSLGLGRKLLNGLLQVGLITCPDLDSWKPSNYDIGNAKGRRFLPTTELLMANIGSEMVNNAAAYLSGEYRQREVRSQSRVVLNPESGLHISPCTTELLEKGTGLRFNLPNALLRVAELTEQKRVRILQAGQAALGWLGSNGPIHTTWTQTRTGRLYASRPAILNLPSALRPALEPLNGGILCEVDFQNFEPRIVHAEAGIPASPGDYAEFVGNQLGLSRENVKAVLNPALHGQTHGNLVGAKEWEKLKNRIKVEQFLKRDFPAVWEMIMLVQKNDSLLQRRGAQVFVPAYEMALTIEDVPAGIPLHDGWVFPAKDEAQLLRVKEIFERVGTEMLGQPTPVKHRIWN